MGIQRAVGQQRAVVLLSGGLDSATCLAIASRDHEVHALTFDYGSKHSREINAAKAIAKHFDAKSHRILKVDLAVIGGSSLTEDSIQIKEAGSVDKIGQTIPNTYVPARNMTFLSLGMALAEVVGASKLFIGANSVDYSGYPDCRPEFIAAFQGAARLGTKAGVEGRPIKIEAPLLTFSKSQIIIKGAELGVPFELTWTCYRGGEKACGKCEACQLRLAGFREAGIDDPVRYEN
ncbi:MAG: 7-cyano-7-deazaguanine synthase QueC [Candidatus Thermoplasmatota archaeon]|nr:7-cyano-7-deazaguanine synthase QueC [Euryarchaeota archaeon]MBU4032450.1 7-cyano-7-deazaguanine synthase QueC [Candidatus Thermoplasmatota archaeon]MBU4071563.1 7-cyano-7-deazaguanine synthase QueC [Candidatus Thermoplasmatota archaeon]MBU4144470.1 7-cyano-7-deazaguanine synthase QueC [Candidatus Thermoplasmatota archaeon]MBU4592298.1 7-cyano-7-deazaguanine synthase QueC [Candidatus Thermoplasmatota archaeon]